jgi:DNA-binding NtrC family response regulator
MRSRHVIDAAWGEAVRPAQQLAAPSHSFPRAAPAGSERVLLVEPDDAQRGHLRNAVRAVAEIDDVSDFLIARTQLISRPYDWLLTNIRLGAYNGLHLVHLAGTSRRPIRSLVYEDRRDIWLAREAQRVGAFYESGARVDRALPAYLRGALPQKDRRNPAEPDRRIASRGGRRCTDSSSAALFA